jgi:hypothetical protein
MMRGERWLLRLGEFLVQAASRRLPRRVRDERYREWTAELPVILHDPDGGRWPRRAARMLGYALDTIRGTAVGPRAHSGKPGNSPLAMLLYASAALYLYFVVTSGTGLGSWVVSSVIPAAGTIGNIFWWRRGKRGIWTAGTFWFASATLMGIGHVALIAARDAHWQGVTLRLITLGGAGANAATVACISLYLMTQTRAFIRRRSQRAAGTPDDPPGRGPAGR